MEALLRSAALAAFGLWSTQLRAAPGLSSCTSAIAVSERAEHLPSQVLSAIGIVESGRIDPHSGSVIPCPWTINVAGEEHVFETAADAIAAVRVARAAGVASIDVGCMQVNLLKHPQAFATLEDAFDPAANVRYAAGFLMRLHAQVGAWTLAMASYHSATPGLGLPYARRVAMLWPQAARYWMGMQPAPSVSDPTAELERVVDPAHVLTPEFRAQLVASLKFRRQRDASLGLAPPGPRVPSTRLQALAFPMWSALLSPARSDRAVANDIDPSHLLTPGFRSECIIVEAFCRRRGASIGWVRSEPVRSAGETR